jgi:plasmid replication initiation protein
MIGVQPENDTLTPSDILKVEYVRCACLNHPLNIYGLTMKRKVVISNELVRASYTLSLNEKRLVMYAVSQIDNADMDGLIEIPAIKCGRFYKMAESSCRRSLKAAMDSLWERELVTPDGLGRRWIISRGKYEDGNIIIQFHPHLAPYLFNLKERFTKYFLERAADFKLFYTWRIFEMLMQFRSTGTVFKSVDDFRYELELTDYYSKDFGRIRNKVIQPAIDEIREKTGLDVQWETKKTGSKVTGLAFTFPPEQQKALPLQPARKKKSASKPPTEEEQTKAENTAALAHYKKMAELSGVPIGDILPNELKATLTPSGADPSVFLASASDKKSVGRHLYGSTTKTQ